MARAKIACENRDITNKVSRGGGYLSTSSTLPSDLDAVNIIISPQLRFSYKGRSSPTPKPQDSCENQEIHRIKRGFLGRVCDIVNNDGQSDFILSVQTPTNPNNTAP